MRFVMERRNASFCGLYIAVNANEPKNKDLSFMLLLVNIYIALHRNYKYSQVSRNNQTKSLNMQYAVRLHHFSADRFNF